MDLATSEFYRRYAAYGGIGAEAPHSAISTFFERAFKAGGKVLDVGSGSGRDVAVLCEKGFDAYGLEPNESMRAVALQNHSALAARLQPGSLPVSGTPFGGEFDGAVCSAVLMHLPNGELAASLESIRDVLKPGGRMLISLPCMRPDLLRNDRDQDGRFFQNHSPASIHSLLQSLGFSEIDLGHEAISEYSDITWTISLFELCAHPRGTTRIA